ncbi:TPA: hypothetical protein ACH3X1_005433 [Trebouxia sp. C0004]
MGARGDDTGHLHADNELDAADVYNPLHLPWQTLSALATETGHAFRQTFTESGLSTSGHVQQGLQYRTSPSDVRKAAEPDKTLLDSGQVSAEERQASSVKPASAHLKAVEEDMSRVARKMLTTDASTEVVLRFNFMSARESRAALLCVVASIVAGAGVLITEFVIKMETGRKPYHFRTTNIYKCNVAIGSACWVLLTGMLVAFGWGVLDAVRHHKHWKHRQRRNVTLIMVEGVLQWFNLLFYVLPNGTLLANPCYINSGTWFWFGFARWTCWNTIFMLFLVHAYSTRVWKLPMGVSSTVSAAAIEHGFQSPEGHSKLVMDGPWILLWPCLLLWPWFEAVAGYGWIHNALHQGGPAPCENSGDPAPNTCGVDRATAITVDIIVASAVLYFVITYALLLSKLKGYRRKPYTSVQVGLVYNTLQLWLRLAVMTFLMLCMVLLWLIGPGWCPSQHFSWLGLMPMQIVMTATTAVLCYAATPRTPQEHVVASSVWLQEFAWTEADKPVKLEARSMMAPTDPTLACQPIFCFQTMMNMLYWSCFVYDHARMNPSARASKGPSEQQEVLQERQQGTAFTARTTLTLETAMSLYKLTESHSFWEVEQDTRCLISSGNNTVVVAFRGTASMRNALADLQAWRIAHPPRRGRTWLGTRPLVHVGFLKSWLAGGLKVKVVNRVLEAVQQCKQSCKSHVPTTVFVTGIHLLIPCLPPFILPFLALEQ